MQSVSIALYNMGGPASVDAVPSFLSALFRDNDLLGVPLPSLLQNTIARSIVNARSHEVQQRYNELGGKSPQLEITQALAKKVFSTLQSRGARSVRSVEAVMRYTEPSLERYLNRCEKEGIEEVWLLSQYPHCSRATTGSFLRQLGLAQKRKKFSFTVRSFLPTTQLPSFRELWRARLAKEFAGIAPNTHLVVSAHGVPKSYVAEGDPYSFQIAQMAYAVAHELNLYEGRDWTLAWQSAVGPAKWLRPYVQDLLPQLRARGIEHLVFWPISFVSDHIETLYEIDKDFFQLAKQLGFQSMRRVENLNDSDDYTNFLCQIVENALAETNSEDRPSRLLRSLSTFEGCEGCQWQPGGCLCERYLQAGLNGKLSGL